MGAFFVAGSYRGSDCSVLYDFFTQRPIYRMNKPNESYQPLKYKGRKGEVCVSSCDVDTVKICSSQVCIVCIKGLAHGNSEWIETHSGLYREMQQRGGENNKLFATSLLCCLGSNGKRGEKKGIGDTETF
jgi:hypothetical protein